MLCYLGMKKILSQQYQKVTNAYVYLNWNSLVSQSWKQGILKTLTQRSYMICSTTELWDTELKPLEKVLLRKTIIQNG